MKHNSHLILTSKSHERNTETEKGQCTKPNQGRGKESSLISWRSWKTFTCHWAGRSVRTEAVPCWYPTDLGCSGSSQVPGSTHPGYWGRMYNQLTPEDAAICRMNYPPQTILVSARKLEDNLVSDPEGGSQNTMTQFCVPSGAWWRKWFRNRQVFHLI